MPSAFCIASESLHLPPAVAGSVIIPRCASCGEFQNVAPVEVTMVDAGTQYWSCAKCLQIWGTRGAVTARDPYRRRCPNCGQEGRYDSADPAWDHRFICMACGGFWTLHAQRALTARAQETS
jgi:hypothetical protein